ncbi:MAG: hypothetical protein M3162_04700 [Thermoproteota archaeon]|nr:hypothetical protein [Thermoproteota archaeon]
MIPVSVVFLFLSLSLVDNSMTPSHPKAFGFFHDKQQQTTMLSYENNDLKFRISYPNTWERSVRINNEVLFIAPKEQDAVSNPAGLVIKAVPLEGKNVTLRSISSALTAELKKEHKDFKLESTNPVSIDGQRAIQTIFTATDSKLQNRKAMQIATMNNENIFIFTYKASIDKFSQFENPVKEMINSFKFMNTTAA